MLVAAYLIYLIRIYSNKFPALLELLNSSCFILYDSISQFELLNDLRLRLTLNFQNSVLACLTEWPLGIAVNMRIIYGTCICKKKKKDDILWVYLEVLTDLSQLAMQAL